jgi:predicted MFS family arabinose efflux permease
VSGGTIAFFAVFTVAYFFRMMNDTAIPVVVSEIIPEEQIGAFTSIRLLVMTGAQSVSALIITPIASAVGYTGLLIFAAVMQALCGIPYYVIYRSKKKQSLQVSEEK